MIPSTPLTIQFRDDATPEKIQVVEVGLKTFLDLCTAGSYGTQIAEAAVRRQSSSGNFDKPVPPGWLDTLTDDSSDAVMKASLDLNLSYPRAKKAAALIDGYTSHISAEKNLTPAQPSPTSNSIQSGNGSNS